MTVAELRLLKVTVSGNAPLPPPPPLPFASPRPQSLGAVHQSSTTAAAVHLLSLSRVALATGECQRVGRARTALHQLTTVFAYRAEAVGLHVALLGVAPEPVEALSAVGDRKNASTVRPTLLPWLTRKN
jgi:hypothetical protein